MKRILQVSWLVIVIGLTNAKAQNNNIGMGTSTPDASAKVEISATNQGLLIPRIALTSTADVTTITSPATSLLVYNTATAGISPNTVTPGFYYWNGSKWERFITGNLFQSKESTASITASNVWQNIPGATLTSNYLAGDVLDIRYSGNFGYSSGTGYAFVDVAPYVNGIMLSVGGYARAEVNSTAPWWVPYSSMATYTIPTTGTYTFDLRTVRSGGAIDVLVGGNSANATECIFTITTYRK